MTAALSGAMAITFRLGGLPAVAPIAIAVVTAVNVPTVNHANRALQKPKGATVVAIAVLARLASVVVRIKTFGLVRTARVVRTAVLATTAVHARTETKQSGNVVTSVCTVVNARPKTIVPTR